MRAKLYRLRNGLRVVLDPIRAVESLTLGAWIEVGARHEPRGLAGAAHLLEHMVFKGTTRRSSFDIVSEIEGRGGSINAYTSRENTAYYCRLLKEDLPLGLDILADMIAGATLRQEDLDKERHVILSELHQSQDRPDDIIFDHFQETAFPRQGLGSPILGREEVLSAVAAAPLRKFRDRAYGAACTRLVVSGRFEEAAARALIEARFAGLPAGELLSFTPGRYAGGCYGEVRQDLEQAHILLGWPGAALEGPGYYVQMLIAALLGGGMSSRLFQRVREQEGLAYNICAYLSAFQDCGLFTAYTATQPEQVKRLLPILAETLWSLRTDLEAAELGRAKQLLKASLLMGQESTLTRAEFFASQVQVFGKLMHNADLLAPLEAVTVDQIKGAITPLFDQDLTFAVIGPEDLSAQFTQIQALFRPPRPSGSTPSVKTRKFPG